MSKQFWGIIAAIVIVFAGIFIVNGNKSESGGGNTSTSAVTNHVMGKGTSGVTLREFGDYQCPACGAFEPTVQQVVAKYGDKIKFQFSNFPLTSIHQNAFSAARAAEAASKQDKFWEMHNALYETQSQWSAVSEPYSTFEQFAKQLGLNTATFKKDYGSSAVNDAINADIAAGTKLNITGTPGFVINGTKTEISNSVESFSKAIDAAIAKQATTNKPTPSTQN